MAFMSADSIFCQTITELFSAGADTAATSLSWAWLYLIKHPDVQAKCHKEIDEVS